MINLTQFSIPINDDVTVHGEYEGNEKSGKVVIFAHGFGVKRDSHGKFNELGDLLKDEYLVVRFDFTKVIPEENATVAYPFSVQTEMLNTVIDYIKSQFSVSSLTILAHSQGGVIASLVNRNDIDILILVATPTTTFYDRMKSHFGKRPESVIDETGVSKLKRSDGSWTYIYPEFWPETKNTNPLELFAQVAQRTKTYFFRALQDDVVIENNYDAVKAIPHLHYYEIPGDHSFLGEYTESWLKTMVKTIKGEL